MKKKRIHIATSRDVGERCLAWAYENTPQDYEIIDSMSDCEIFISVLYDTIVPPDFLNIRDCYNFHPGVLPEYRGAGAFSWCLINKEAKTGITLHKIAKGIDDGDIIEIREFLIAPQDTASTLFAKGEKLIFKMFKDWYKDLLSKEYIAVPQNEQNSRIYYRKDLNKAKDLTNIIKAFYFPGKEAAYFINSENKKEFIVYK
tara:strand:- start:1238 stop:1840 length:603 start_codon:yes stop_codon:yes gene_type:complete